MGVLTLVEPENLKIRRYAYMQFHLSDSKIPLTKVLGEAKMTRRGQITVPVQVREYFELKDGDYVIFKEEGGKLLLARAVLRES